MDIYLLEAVLNGVLLGGVLALLALGLNLIFGVVDVVWIAYAELVMCGMYAIYCLLAFFACPCLRAAGGARLMPLGAAIRRAPVRRQFLRPDHLHDMCARRARQHDRRLCRRLDHEPDHLGRRLLLLDRVLLCAGLSVVRRDDLRAAAG